MRAVKDLELFLKAAQQDLDRACEIWSQKEQEALEARADRDRYEDEVQRIQAALDALNKVLPQVVAEGTVEPEPATPAGDPAYADVKCNGCGAVGLMTKSMQGPIALLTCGECGNQVIV